MDAYYNGEQKSGVTTFPLNSGTSGSGQMVFGRKNVDFDSRYATMEIDELTLWNN